MAVSKETEAIIERLKAEGDLIRNSGTNSVRSVNLKLDKFDGLFTSINTQIVEQTGIMKAQLGINQDTQEKTRTQEQFEELNNQRNTNSQQNEEARRGERGDNFIAAAEKIGEKFTLKNMALMAAGGFITYNLLKGFIEQGVKDNLLGMGDFAEQIKKLDIITFQEAVTSIKNSLNTISTTITDFNDKIKDFMDKTWVEWIGTFITNIPTMMALTAGLKLANTVLKNRAAGKTGANLVKALLAGGMTAAALKDFGIDEKDIKAGQKAYDEEIKAKGSTSPKQPMTTAPTSPGSANAGSLKPIPLDDFVVSKNGDKILAGGALDAKVLKYNSEIDAGIRTGPKIDINDAKNRATALRQARNASLGASKLDSKGAGGGVYDLAGNKGTGKLGKEMLNKFRSKIPALVSARIGMAGIKQIPGLGAIAGGVFAAWSLIRGDTTSFALEGTSIFLPSVAGAPVDVTAIATSVFFDFTGVPFNPANEDHVVIMEEISVMVRDQIAEYLDEAPKETGGVIDSYGQGFENMSQQDILDMYGTGGSAYNYNNTPDYMKYLDGSNFNPYTGKYENTITTGPGSRGGMRGPRPGQGKGFGVLSPEALELIDQNNRQANVQKLAPAMQAYLDSVAQETAPSVTVIAPQNNVSAPVSMVDGGSQVSMNSYGFGEAGRATNNPMGIPGVTSGLVH